MSYSLYLLHPLAIYLTAIFVGGLFEPGLMPTAVAVAIILPFSLALANVGYALFEAPSISAGRELTVKLGLNDRASTVVPLRVVDTQ